MNRVHDVGRFVLPQGDINPTDSSGSQDVPRMTFQTLAMPSVMPTRIFEKRDSYSIGVYCKRISRWHNSSYFPIFIDAEKYGMTRDELYFKMKEQGVLGRRYFYPLISEFSTYRSLPSAAKENLPQAHKMADSVICLPMHHALSEEDIERILNYIIK